MENVNDKIILSEEELLLFETFLQYGDLENAKLVFIGMEEGLGRCCITTAINARIELATSDFFKHSIVFLNGIDFKDGWYLNDSDYLDCAIKKVCPDYIKIQESHDSTMRFQSRMHWLLQNNNRTSNYRDIVNQNFGKYNNLHKPGSNSAMIDYFPLLKVGATSFPYAPNSKFSDRDSYYKYFKKHCDKNNRWIILKNIYDKYPMAVSIVYSGIENYQFRLKAFYDELRFSFEHELESEQYTDSVQPDYSKYINPSKPEKRRKFLLGNRVNDNGAKQIVVLTPFFGQGQISNNDIDVISSWIST